MFKRTLLSLFIALLAIPTAFAAGTTESTTTATSAGNAADTTMPCYNCGYGDGISFNVSSIETVSADHVYLYGTYNVYEFSSKKDVVKELASAFTDLKSATSSYGVLTRTSLYTYTDWSYTNLYDGTLSVKLELTKHSALNDMEDLFYEKNFDNWADIQVEDTNAAEKSAIPTLKTLIKEQKEIYEELLSYSLGKITGLSIYTTVDTSTFNPDTNTVDLTVWADVSYQAQ